MIDIAGDRLTFQQRTAAEQSIRNFDYQEQPAHASSQEDRGINEAGEERGRQEAGTAASVGDHVDAGIQDKE